MNRSSTSIWPNIRKWLRKPWILIPLLLIGSCQAMLLPFSFTDEYIVVGDEEAIHRKNFTRMLKEEAEHSELVAKLAASVPESELYEAFEAVFPKCCWVKLERIATSPKKIPFRTNQLYVFISSIFRMQVYYYDIYYKHGSKNFSIHAIYQANGAKNYNKNINRTVNSTE